MTSVYHVLSKTLKKDLAATQSRVASDNVQVQGNFETMTLQANTLEEYFATAAGDRSPFHLICHSFKRNLVSTVLTIASEDSEVQQNFALMIETVDCFIKYFNSGQREHVPGKMIADIDAAGSLIPQGAPIRPVPVQVDIPPVKQVVIRPAGSLIRPGHQLVINPVLQGDIPPVNQVVVPPVNQVVVPPVNQVVVPPVNQVVVRPVQQVVAQQANRRATSKSKGTCKFCPEGHIGRISDHLLDIHCTLRADGFYQCNVCINSKGYISDKAVTGHIFGNHWGQFIPTITCPFDRCNRKFITQDLIDEHYRDVHIFKPAPEAVEQPEGGAAGEQTGGAAGEQTGGAAGEQTGAAGEQTGAAADA